MTTRIAYLVHDLNDASVARRTASFQLGGAQVALAGFYRREAVSQVSGAHALPLAQSRDAGLAHRACLVLATAARRGPLRKMLRDADVIVARNLEMLVIAARHRRKGQRLIYECLDIHRLMARDDAAGSTIRYIERQTLLRCDAVIVSSPAFVRNHFAGRQQYQGTTLLVENKVMASNFNQQREKSGEGQRIASAGPPWKIGWFGMIRCRRSLEILSRAVAVSDGRIELLIAGRPSLGEFEDFHGCMAAVSGIEFVGPYDPADLSSLYNSVHFSWCIDFFEEGLNSQWLLPNRLYESIANSAVPIALADVETGRWLTDASIGLLLKRAEDLGVRMSEMRREQYLRLKKEVDAVPRATVAFGIGIMNGWSRDWLVSHFDDA